MRNTGLALLFIAILTNAALAYGSQALQASGTSIELVKTPNGGIQPQAAIDGRGMIHLVYLKGDPSAADVYYVHRGPGKESWSAPVRVNSIPGSAIAVGTIRGAQIALGRNGRVHVVWNGSERAMPRADSSRGAP